MCDANVPLRSSGFAGGQLRVSVLEKTLTLLWQLPLLTCPAATAGVCKRPRHPGASSKGQLSGIASDCHHPANAFVAQHAGHGCLIDAPKPCANRNRRWSPARFPRAPRPAPKATDFRTLGVQNSGRVPEPANTIRRKGASIFSDIIPNEQSEKTAGMQSCATFASQNSSQHIVWTL